MPDAFAAAPHAELQQAWTWYARGERQRAEAQCRDILARRPEDPQTASLLGVILAQAGRTKEAAVLLGRAAERMPNDASAHSNYGNALRDLGRSDAALTCYDRALALQPSFAEAHYNRGVALLDLRRHGEAIDSFDRAVSLKPGYAAAWNNRGTALRELGRRAEALASYDRALESRRDYFQALNNRGVVLQELGRLDEALESYDRALAFKQSDAETLNNRSTVLRKLGRFEEALASAERAVACRPDRAEGHCSRGVSLTCLGRLDEALESLRRALELDPHCVDAHRYRGVALHELKRYHEALDSYEHALVLMRDPEIYLNMGAVLAELNRPEEAISSYERAAALDPDTKFLLGDCRGARMQVCDWSGFDSDILRLRTEIESGRAVTSPFILLSLLDSPALQRKAAEVWVREKYARSIEAATPLVRHPDHPKVRIGYFSADFRNHAVAALTAELFESHDRFRFEISAFSLGPDVRDELRTRIEPTFDRFLSLSQCSDEQVVELARKLEIDIAVDLGGYTRDARPGIFARRAAPVQVSYLGYLGTLGAEFMDYLLADQIIVPPHSRDFYSEKIAYLPCYQVNDSKRPIAEKVFTREELGLPPRGFVFCCFNGTFKITPETFASWMRILAAVPDSVLFLLGDRAAAERNLRLAAGAHGISSNRIVFGRRLPFGEYMARYRAADLFLDTLPYNAGTTASDALWAGLPVLTCPGESFAARVAASVVAAAGLPELIASNREHYERLAVELATNPDRLGAIRRELAAARESARLFDIRAFTRSLEALYLAMYERHRAGLPTQHLFPPEADGGCSREESRRERI